MTALNVERVTGDMAALPDATRRAADGAASAEQWAGAYYSPPVVWLHSAPGAGRGTLLAHARRRLDERSIAMVRVGCPTAAARYYAADFGADLVVIAHPGGPWDCCAPHAEPGDHVIVVPADERADVVLAHATACRAARLLVVTKTDLARGDAELLRLVGYARDAHPNIEVIYTSTVTGEGLEEWAAWLARRART